MPRLVICFHVSSRQRLAQCQEHRGTMTFASTAVPRSSFSLHSRGAGPHVGGQGQPRQEAALELRPVRRGASHAKIWQKRVPGRRNSKGKGHEGDRRLELLRKVRRCGWRVISSRSREAAGAGPSGRGLGSVPRNEGFLN